MAHHNCELAERTTIHAFRCGANVLIVAEGQLPDPGWDARITQLPARVFPPHYSLEACRRPGSWPLVLVPYKVSLTIPYPEDADTVRVGHADGEDDVQIEPCGDALAVFAGVAGPGGVEALPATGAAEATGFSKQLSFDEAFRDALSKLPAVRPVHPDQMERVVVEEIGALFGGIAGFNDLYVRISRTHD